MEDLQKTFKMVSNIYLCQWDEFGAVCLWQERVLEWTLAKLDLNDGKKIRISLSGGFAS